MKKHFSFLVALSLVITLILAVAAPIIAQENGSKVSISPVTYNLTANAGDTLREVIKVRNDAAATQNVVISAENFVAVGEDGDVGLTDEETAFSLASWIRFDDTEYTLRSGEEVQVPFTIRVPFNAEPGGHYASVYAQVAPNPSDGSGSGIGQKIGSLVLLRVAGDVKEDASVESLVFEQSEEGGEGLFVIRVKNEGSVHIRPEGFVAVTDIFGNKIADVQIDSKNVFPGAVRRMEAKWTDPPFIGRYTANMLAYYGANNKQLTASTTFWIIPWRTLAIWGGAALVVLIILYLGRKRIGRSAKALVSGK